MFKNKIRSLTVAAGLVATLAMATPGSAFAAGTVTPGDGPTSASVAVSGAAALAITAPNTLDFPGVNLAGVATTSASPGSAFPIGITDATGTGKGWSVTLSATTFTGAGTGHPTLADIGTLTVPSTITPTNTTGTAPVNTVVHYPVAITTASSAPTPSPIYTANATTGLGNSELDTPLTLAIPADTKADTYSSTITVSVASLP